MSDSLLVESFFEVVSEMITSSDLVNDINKDSILIYSMCIPGVSLNKQINRLRLFHHNIFNMLADRNYNYKIKEGPYKGWYIYNVTYHNICFKSFELHLRRTYTLTPEDKIRITSTIVVIMSVLLLLFILINTL